MKIFNKLKNTYPKIIHANGAWDNSVKSILEKIDLKYINPIDNAYFVYNDSEINSTHDIFIFNKNNIPLNSDIGIYTWNNRLYKDKWLFELICEINNLTYTNLIDKKEFTTFDKLYTINQEVKRLKSINSPIKYLFCCDSKDVFFIEHPNFFINDFLIEKKLKMVINAETNDYPNNITNIEKNNPMPFKYLNSGAYIAEINFLEFFTDYAISITEQYRSQYLHDPHCLDQLLFKKTYEIFNNDVLLDCNTDLFLCLYGCNQDWIEINK